MQKKIALIELYEHSEVLRSCYEQCEEIGVQILVATSPKIKEDLENAGLKVERAEWILLEEGWEVGRFLKIHEAKFMACSQVFLLTVNRPFVQFTNLTFLDKTTLLIHNAHAFLAPTKHLNWNWSNWVGTLFRHLRFLLSGDRYHLRYLLEAVSVWAFPSDFCRSYALQNDWVPVNRSTMTLHLGVYRDSSLPSNKESIQVCIPGTVKSNGRDYSTIIQAFEQILPTCQEKVVLVLLGSPKGTYGHAVQKQFRRLSIIYPHFYVQTYSDPVSQDIYDSQLLNADFLVLAVGKYARYNAYYERLGYSTITGTANDMLRFGRPTLLPHTYPMGGSGSILIEHYRGRDDLAMLLADWIKSKKYREKGQKFRKAADLDLIKWRDALVQKLKQGIR